MPASFLKCVSGGGKVRTISFGGDSYRRVCYKGGKSYQGEVHKKKSSRKIK